MAKNKKVTLDNLAIMIQKQFQSIESNMATKNDIKQLNNRFDGVNQRLTVIEALLASDRIERLEDSMRQVKTLLKLS